MHTGHTAITRPPLCRWCDKEPEFAPVPGDASVCPHCEAMQDPVLRLRGPKGAVLAFFVNPDDSIFFEVVKKDGTARYEFSPAQLAKAGSFTRTPLTLNGKRIDKPL